MDINRLLNNDESIDDTVSLETTEHTQLRAGKWTTEELRYATALAQHFIAGTLAIPSGTSLRCYLAQKLHCSAMRVSTKLAGDVLGGFTTTRKLGLKRFFPTKGLTTAQRDNIARELRWLRADFVRAANLGELVSEDEPITRVSCLSSSSSSSTVSVTSDDETDAPWRVGCWSHVEQLYACALIDGFMRGRVNVAQGTTLRAFLAARLCCNPMRISKKLATGKMASTDIPRRLGSVTYHLQAVDTTTVHSTEHALERLRLQCFPIAPKSVQEEVQPRPSSIQTQVCITSPVWQERSHQRYETWGQDDNGMSSLHAGWKRMLWLPPPDGDVISLPPLVLSSFHTMTRRGSDPFC